MMLLLTFITTLSMTMLNFGSIDTEKLAFTAPEQLYAQSCTEYGNLTGTMWVENLPGDNDHNVIWTSSTSDPWDGGPTYAVDYNLQLEEFTGMGWNEGLGVWIDFDWGTSDQARALDSNLQPVEGFTWGYWDGIIEGLDNIQYSTQEGGFVVNGQQPSDGQCVSGSCDNDVEVGFGELYFDYLYISDPASACPESVDVWANGQPEINLNSCGTSVDLVWTSNNVEEGSCITVDNGAPWPEPGNVTEVQTTPVQSNYIEEDPVYFEIECIGSLSGNPVNGMAKVTCGEPGGPEDMGDDQPFIFEEN